jgi:eukaryotic-like serine/threonine-protein kinase
VSLKKLGRYELVRVLGKGAMGIVYEGRDPNLDRRVAIKTVKVENLSEEAAAEYESRFRTEARSAARLQHPNIVSVYDSDRDGNNAFLVMEYIQGEDLKHYLDKGARYSLEQSLRMIRDLLSALEYAHQQGIVHRDIKPANLLLDISGRLKLTDFGVARIQDSGDATRTQGAMIGTLKYMAPEQVQGLKADSRADLFSVGVVLYQLLTDKRPFDGDNDFSIIHQIIGQDPPPPSSINSRLPAAIDAVVARAMAKDREQRFATARDFATALQSAIRRAPDASILPPADPLKKVDAGGSGSKGPQGVGTNSAVTQEVELVYWKDIKESADPEDLESFLEKFPAGIYADLARRRLRKLTEGANDASPDQTVLTGMDSSDGGAGASEQDLDAAQLRAETSAGPMIESEASKVEAAHESAADLTEAADKAPMVVEPQSPEVPEPVAEATEPEEIAGTVDAPEAKPSARKRPIATLVSAGALLVAGLVVFMLMGKSPQPAQPPLVDAVARAAAPPQAQAQTQAPAAPASAADAVSFNVSPKPASVPPIGPRSVASTAAAGPVQSNTAAPAKPASAVAKAKPASSGSPVAEVHRPAPTVTATAAREEARVAAAYPPGAPSPVEACRERWWLFREFCLADVCEKPGSRSHSLCVTWRADKRLREDGKYRQGP